MQNARCQVQVTAFSGLPYAAVIEILVSCTSYWAYNFGTKGLSYFVLLSFG
jgi:hypothetical protein